MLMRFSVLNYMSFGYKEDQDGNIKAEEFYLYAGASQQFKDRVIHFGSRKVLKFSSVYGANASGKTNLVRAIECGKRIILSTMNHSNIREQYCKNKKKNKDMPTLFEYEFTIGEKNYAYGFTVNLWNQIVLSEWLYELNEIDEMVIFERDAERNEYYFDEARFSNRENRNEFHFFIKDANRVRNSLLLYELQRRELSHSDYNVFLSIYDWFKNKLIIIYPETKIGASYYRFESDNKKLVKVLDYLDTGITGYQMQPLNETAFREFFADSSLADEFLNIKETDKGILCYGGTLFELKYNEKGIETISKLLFEHGADENSYEYGEESDGTQRLVELLDIILNDIDERVFVIDELDRSLHPQMTRKFVETFLDFTKATTTQLIITTHESSIMDLAMLRRDEIWFAERERDNTTTLYTLEKFKVRYDKVVSKDYLAGRYGAVPVFKDFDYVWGCERTCND